VSPSSRLLRRSTCRNRPRPTCRGCGTWRRFRP
jgi:hypothetical protein